MSARVFDPTCKIGVLVAALALSGCVGTGPQAGSGTGGFAFSRAAPQKLAVAGGTVTIAGPQGFCIDGRASRDGADGAFVLMASCAAITRNRKAPVPPEEALLTASVSPQPGPGGSAKDRALVLKRYFASDEGRAALARDGRPGSIAIDEMRDRDGLFLIHARDRSAGLASGLRDDFWRAIFEVNGRIVTASVVGMEAQPFSTSTGLNILRDFAARIRTESARLPAAMVTKAPQIPEK
ncbi:MAG: hypothetical protein JXJ18_13170 [Rhodobacteraceae bacterium]|nr:hypothetical protein [Paracoccaceae bacterium]